jgi:hypothetical protein
MSVVHLLRYFMCGFYHTFPSLRRKWCFYLLSRRTPALFSIFLMYPTCTNNFPLYTIFLLTSLTILYHPTGPLATGNQRQGPPSCLMRQISHPQTLRHVHHLTLCFQPCQQYHLHSISRGCPSPRLLLRPPTPSRHIPPVMPSGARSRPRATVTTEVVQ